MSNQQESRLGQQIGEYRLVHKIGGGSFGTVYLAEHVHEHTQAAVKVLNISLTKRENVKNFINEASTIRLRHPHIVPLLNFGISRDDLPFLVMEYAPQGTLRDRHPTGERLPLSTIVSYVDQLASALQYAHDQRIIHRDIKPENILVRADETLLVSDFGLAKLMEQNTLPSQQKLAGTPLYMSPEQHKGFPCFASDQYSLAVIIYEWICGVRPFQGTGLGLAVQHMHASPPKLRDHLPELPETIERIVLKALAKAPEDRFKHIQEMASALHETVQPSPNTLVLNPPIEAIDTLALTTPEQKSQLPPSSMPEVLVDDLEVTAVRPTIQRANVPMPLQKSAPPLPTPPEPHMPPSQHKQRLGRRFALWMGGTLALISLLIILILVLRPILLVRGVPSTTPTTNLHTSSPTLTHVPSPTPIQIVQKWIFSTGYSVWSSPTVQNDVLYIGSQDHNVYAIDANTGVQKWVFPTNDAVAWSSPVLVNGILYIGSQDHNVYAIDAKTGQKKWAFPTGDMLLRSPAVANGVLYIGSVDHNVYALDAKTGLLKWAFPTGGPVESPPTVVDGVLYIGSDDHKVYAIDTSTGQKKWVFSTGGGVFSSPTVLNGVLYVGSDDHNVYSIDANTGQKKSAFPTGGKVWSSPTIVNGVLYIGSQDSSVYAIDISTGQKIWSFTATSQVNSSATITNGVLYIGSDDGNVYALTLPA